MSTINKYMDRMVAFGKQYKVVFLVLGAALVITFVAFFVLRAQVKRLPGADAAAAAPPQDVAAVAGTKYGQMSAPVPGGLYLKDVPWSLDTYTNGDATHAHVPHLSSCNDGEPSPQFWSMMRDYRIDSESPAEEPRFINLKNVPTVDTGINVPTDAEVNLPVGL